MFTSGLWTVAEVAGYFNQRQNRFNRDTKLMLAHEAITVTSGAETFPLPSDWIATLRATWTNAAGVMSPLTRADRTVAERGIIVGNVPNRPVVLDDHSGGTLIGELYPPPTTDGVVELLYASVLETMAFGDTPDVFDIPDEFVPYVTYGVMADMLSKEGRGRDLARARYCEERYDEGVAIAGILLGGFL